jgi:hypothetical protein
VRAFLVVAALETLEATALRHQNQPFKSMHQTSLAAPQLANGAVRGGVRRRLRRGTTRPSRRNKSPMLLTAGQLTSG